MTDVRVREARRDDAATIIEFQVAMALETEEVTLDRDILTRGVYALFDSTTMGRYFVAESDGRVVASLLITYEWSDWRNGMVWWIQSVYTIPEFRRRGIYASLYAHIKAQVEPDPNIRGIRLYVDNRNRPAMEVYKRLGMEGEHYRVFEWMK
jgi:GNAT superfamily N-acetyltransferase